jgi:hypothetical protein
MRSRADMYFRTQSPRGLIPLSVYHHIPLMIQWQKSFTREPPKTKAELREMLAEAVRNTEPETKRQSKSKRDRGLGGVSSSSLYKRTLRRGNE